MHLLEQGFTFWDGVMYCYTCDFHHDQPLYAQLKNAIRSIGGDNFLLHMIITDENEKNDLLQSLKNNGIEKRTLTAGQMASPEANHKKLAHHREKLQKPSPKKQKQALPSQQDQESLQVRSILFTIKQPTQPASASQPAQPFSASPLAHIVQDMHMHSQATEAAKSSTSPTRDSYGSPSKKARKNPQDAHGGAAAAAGAGSGEELARMAMEMNNPDNDLNRFEAPGIDTAVANEEIRRREKLAQDERAALQAACRAQDAFLAQAEAAVADQGAMDVDGDQALSQSGPAAGNQAAQVPLIAKKDLAKGSPSMMIIRAMRKKNSTQNLGIKEKMSKRQRHMALSWQKSPVLLMLGAAQT